MEVDKSSSEEVVDILTFLICQVTGDNLDFTDSASLFQGIGDEIKKSLSTLERQPVPICKGIKMPTQEWNALDKFAKKMTADYMTRAEMIIRRLDVTIDSFFWSERIQNLEPQINKVYNPNRELISEWKPIRVEDVLAASDELLILEKASSYKQRIATKSEISNFLLNDRPKDRGGRVGEIIAPVRASFNEQRSHEKSNFSRGRERGGYNKGQGNREGRDNVEGQTSNDSDQHDNRDAKGQKHSGNQRGGHRTRPY